MAGMKKIVAALALGAGLWGLSACERADDVSAVAPADDGVTVSDPRMVLNAVSGRPAAIYFTVTNNRDRPITIRGASVADAQSAELHEYMEWDRQMVMGQMGPLVLQPGESVEFVPGGRHLMAMGVAPTLQPGGTTEVTLNLLGGGSETFSTPILAAGSVAETPPPVPAATGAAAGHNHQ